MNKGTETIHGSVSDDIFQCVRIDTLHSVIIRIKMLKLFHTTLRCASTNKQHAHTHRISNVALHAKSSKPVVNYFSYTELSQGLILHPAAICNIQQRQDSKWSIISEVFLLYLVNNPFLSNVLHKHTKCNSAKIHTISLNDFWSTLVQDRHVCHYCYHLFLKREGNTKYGVTFTNTN